MSNSYGREDRKEARKWLGFGIVTWIVILIVVALVGAGIWGVRVLTSGVKGQGDAVIQNNSAENWIAAQAEFEKNYAAIKADDIKITNAYKTVQTDPSDRVAKTNYDGLVSHCLTLVADYNADARSFLSQDWRAIDLPSQIETEGLSADSAADCKENI